jgi:hypothetical protein
MEHVIETVLSHELSCPTLFAHTDTDEAREKLKDIVKKDKLNIAIVGSAYAYDIARVTRIINTLIRPFKDPDSLRVIFYDNSELAYIIKKWGEHNKIEIVPYEIESEYRLNGMDEESPHYWRAKALQNKALIRRDQRMMNDTDVLIYLHVTGEDDKAIDNMYQEAISKGKFVTKRNIKGGSHGKKRKKA